MSSQRKSEFSQIPASNSTEKVKIAVSDIDGILRGKIISKEKFISALKKGIGFCDVVFGWDVADACYENCDFTGWHTGYPDRLANIDLQTSRMIPWENNTPFFLADFPGTSVCPRTLLKSIISRANGMGFSPNFSQEFEWFNFDETPWSLAEKNYKNIKPLTPGMFGYSILRSSLPGKQNSQINKVNNQADYSPSYFDQLFEWLNQFGIPIEGLHTETGPGVYEAAIRYSECLEAADRAILFKTAVRQIAYRYGIVASFMAKWNTSLPGCSGHVHQSLWDLKQNRNLFYEEQDNQKMSNLMKHYIAGQLHCLPYILPMLAPTINSYKRLVPGMWAPTTLTWAVDNRTVALRVLPIDENSCRLETRVCGSDSNPYLALAACLASGLYGIKNKLKLQSNTLGNGYKDLSNGVLPGPLADATKAMRKSKIAKELFGASFVDHFTSTREWECHQSEKNSGKFNSKEITEWELKRYFEII